MNIKDNLTALGFTVAEYQLEQDVICFEHGNVCVSVGGDSRNITAVKFPEDIDETSIVVTYNRWDDTLEHLLEKWTTE
jgi:actin-like ATPase involved in cell morphogenesis